MNKRINGFAGGHGPVASQQWPGNIRELENAVERAMVVGQEPELNEQDFIFKQPASSHRLRERNSKTWSGRTFCEWWKNVVAIRAMRRKYSTSTGSRCITS